MHTPTPAPGDRVTFPVVAGDRPTTATGTVVASPLDRWRKVRVDGTSTTVEVRTDRLTVLSGERAA